MQRDKALVSMFETLFDSLRQGVRDSVSATEYLEMKDRFVFNMVECQEDFQQIAGLYAEPENRDPDSATELFVGFFYHVVPHLNNACKLLLDGVPGDERKDDG